MLFSYNSFAVSTIDSFFQNVLRAFAFDLDIDLNYQVEMRDKYVIAIAARTMLYKAGEKEYGQAAYDWLNAYVKELVEEDNSNANVFANLSSSSKPMMQVASKLTTEQFAQLLTKVENFLADIKDTDKKEKDTRIVRFETEVKKLYLNAICRLDKCVHDAEHMLTKEIPETYSNLEMSRNSGIADLRKLSEIEISGSGHVSLAKVKEAKIKDEAITAANVKNWYKKDDSKAWKNEGELHEKLAVIATDLRTRTNKAFAQAIALKSVQRHIYYFGLLGFMLKEMDAYRRDNGIILLSDTAQLLQRVIHENCDVPYIYERFGTVFHHFLIDEFQDTSRTQYTNFLPLLENSVAGTGENLVIGDEKQSIYGFRDAEPQLFQHQVQADFKASASVDASKVTNWRSRPIVVAFNNMLFTKLAAKCGLSDEYKHVRQKDKKAEGVTPGFVKVVYVNPAKNDNGKDQTSKSAFMDTMLERLPDYINEIRERGYKLKDIALLIRRNTEGHQIISRLLSYNATIDDPAKRINVISAESLLLSKSIAVNIVVSKLALLASRQAVKPAKGEKDSSILARINRKYRVLNLLSTKLMEAENAGKLDCDNKDAFIGSLLQQSFAEVDAGAVADDTVFTQFDTLMQKAPCCDVTSVSELVINELPQSIKEREIAFIYAFQDFVYDFAAEGNATLQRLLSRWEQYKDKLTINSPDDIDAVTVMTVHKAKGLEFPVVILPELNWELESTRDDGVWATNDELQELNIFPIGADDIPPLTFVDTTPHMQALCDLARDNGTAPANGTDFAVEQRIANAQRNAIFENLNVAYVAFTRPCVELHVMAFNTDLGKNVRDLLNEYTPCEVVEDYPQLPEIEATDGGAENWYSKIITFGEPEQCDISRDKHTAGKSEPMPVYSVGIPQPKFIIAENANQDRGNRYHYLLSLLSDKSRADLVLHRARRITIPEEHQEFEKVVNLLTTSPQTAEWFAPKAGKVLLERTIVEPSPNGNISHRPDRVIILPDGAVTIIDYKFGDPTADKKTLLPQPSHGLKASQATVMQAYQKQVSEYMRIYKSLGYSEVSGYLIYPLHGLSHQSAWVFEVNDATESI